MASLQRRGLVWGLRTVSTRVLGHLSISFWGTPRIIWVSCESVIDCHEPTRPANRRLQPTPLRAIVKRRGSSAGVRRTRATPMARHVAYDLIATTYDRIY